MAIRPAGELLMMETMLFPTRSSRPASSTELPDSEDLKATDRELTMAQQLIDSLTSDFEPDRYHDEYREKVLELVERKAQGEEIATQPEAPEPAKVPDLMAALEASLAAVKDTTSQGNGKADGKAKSGSSSSKSGGSRSKGSGSRSKATAKK